MKRGQLLPLLICMAVSAQADAAVSLEVGQALEISLSDSVSAESSATLPLESRQVIVIDARSSDFDPVLRARLPGESVWREDDDSAGDLNAGLVLRAGEEGEAEIQVRSFASGAAGEATLQARAVEAGILELNASAEGTLGEAPAVYEFEMPANATIMIEASSAAFDPTLLACLPDGTTLFNDDAGAGSTAQVVLPAQGGGAVLLAVSGFDDRRGAFTLSAGPYVAPPPVEIASTSGGLLPEFTLRDTEGREVSSSVFDGKVRIVDVWATWCGPCVMEIPHFIELMSEYGERGVVVIGLSIDEDPEVVPPFMRQQGINYPILMGTEELTEELGRLTPEGEIQGIPTTFIVDQEGRIAEVFVGYREKEEFVAVIERLIAD